MKRHRPARDERAIRIAMISTVICSQIKPPTPRRMTSNRSPQGAGIASPTPSMARVHTKRMLYQVGPVVERRADQHPRDERSSDPKAVHLCMVLQPGVSGSWREFLHETFSLKRIPTIDADTPIDLADA